MPRTAKKKVVKKKPAVKKPVAKKAVKKPAAKKKIDKSENDILEGGVTLHLEEPETKTVIDNGACKAMLHSVRLSAGSTLNLGNFESARFDVGVTLSALDSETTPEDLAEVGWDFIRTELAAKVKAVRNKNNAARDDA